MAWEISISNEGWQEIYEACHNSDVETLARALADYNYEVFHGHHGAPGQPHHRGAWNWRRLAGLAQETLADACFECIQAVGTCDAGGYRYWIDPEGYHGITLTD